VGPEEPGMAQSRTDIQRRLLTLPPKTGKVMKVHTRPPRGKLKRRSIAPDEAYINCETSREIRTVPHHHQHNPHRSTNTHNATCKRNTCDWIDSIKTRTNSLTNHQTPIVFKMVSQTNGNSNGLVPAPVMSFTEDDRVDYEAIQRLGS
jgi:hypothetical protein